MFAARMLSRKGAATPSRGAVARSSSGDELRPASESADGRGGVLQPRPGPGSGNDWMLWAIPIAAVLVLGVGAVLLLALREGPGKATANVPPAA